MSKRLPQTKAGDRQRHELSRTQEELAAKTEVSIILRGIASQVARVRDLSKRREKLLNSLDWAVTHQTGKLVHEELCDCKKELELMNTAQIEEWLYQTLIGKKPYQRYPTKPDADDVGEGPEEDDSGTNYSYPYATPRKKAGSPGLPDNPLLVRLLRQYLQGGGSLETIIMAASSGVEGA